MLLATSGFTNKPVQAIDGQLGKVTDFYFDDKYWTLRYLVVTLGSWLTGRQVLVSPASITSYRDKVVTTDLTREKVRESPPVDAHEPVSRQQEERLHLYFGWPPYWMGDAMMVGGAAYPPIPGGANATQVREREDSRETAGKTPDELEEPHLRSVDAVKGYRIHAEDGDMGHVDDLIFDDDDARVRYIVVDTGNWLPGRKVLIMPDWIREIAWADRAAYVRTSKETVKDAPEYDPSLPVNRDYEMVFHDYYGRAYYWDA